MLFPVPVSGVVMAGFLVDLGFAEYAERPLSEAIAIVDDFGDVRLGAIGRRALIAFGDEVSGPGPNVLAYACVAVTEPAGA